MRQAALYRYRIALNPALPAGRTLLHERCGLVVALTDEQGRQGLGEIAPLTGFNRETLDEATAAAIKALGHWRAAQPLPAGLPPSVRWGLDSASANLDAPLPTELPNGPALLAGSPSQQLARWRDWQGPRPAAIKVKIGRQPPAADQQLLAELLATAPVRLRLDANRSWNLALACHFWQGLSEPVRAAIDWIEEPLENPRQLLTLHQQTAASGSPLPYALDESLAELPLPRACPPGLAALIAKPTVLGGEQPVAQLAALASQWQRPLLLSSALESSLGLRHIARLAARYTPAQPPGLDSWQPFAADLFTPLAAGRPALSLEQLNRLWPG